MQLVQIHPWFSPLHPSQQEGQTRQTNSLNHLCLSLRRAVFGVAGLLRVTGTVLFDLLLLFRGVWASVSPATCGEGSCLCCQRSFESAKLQGQKVNLVGFFLWWKSRFPKGTELMGSIELGWNAAGVCIWERGWRGGCCHLKFLSDPFLLLLAASS